jgi:hypothetical protein
MKWYHGFLILALAVFACNTAFADANLHLSSLPPGTVWNKLDWQAAENGEIASPIIILGTINQIEQNGTGWIYICAAASKQETPVRWPMGTVIVFVQQKIPYFQEGMIVAFYAKYLQSVLIQITDANSGEQMDGKVPVFKASEWGIHLLK